MLRVTLATFLLAACNPNIGASDGELLGYPSHRGTVDYNTDVTGLNFGGTAMGGDSMNVYLIFYGNFSPNGALKKTILKDCMTGLSDSPLANVLSSYGDGAGNRLPAHYVMRSTSLSSATGPLTSSDGPSVVKQSGFPIDESAVYVIYTGPNIALTSGSGEDACNVCGWHSHGTIPGTSKDVKFAFINDPDGCDPLTTTKCIPTLPSPNGNAAADKMAGTTWHELAEAITDPNGNGYHGDLPSATDEKEIGDMCGSATWAQDGNPGHWVVGAVQLDLDYTSGGGTANVHLGNRDFHTQGIWQDIDRGGCVRRLMPSHPAAAIGGPSGDLDRNGVSDLVYRDTASDRVVTWLVNPDNTWLDKTVGNASRHYQIYGIADFNNDGSADILWRNLDDNHLSLWLLQDGVILQDVTIANGVNIKHQIKGVGDFDGNGRADILFLDVQTNEVHVWFNHNFNTFTVSSLPLMSPGLDVNADYETIGTGDFDKSGRASVLWHDLSGSADKYVLSKFASPSTATWSAPFTVPATWVVGIVDIDQDGRADLVGYTGTSLAPANVVWAPMTSWGTVGAATTILAWPSTEWRFSGGGVFGTAPNRTGLLWRNRMTGDISRWLLNTDGSFNNAIHIGVGVEQHFELVTY